MPTALTPEQLARDLNVRDLTDPSEGSHALQLVIDLAVDALTTAWGCEAARGLHQPMHFPKPYSQGDPGWR
jgi:hypothetical protein